MKRKERERIFEALHQETGITSDQYYLAYKKVKRIKGFYIHLLVYVLVNLFLLFNRRMDAQSNTIFYQWQTYSTFLFWGIGLVAHGLTVFGKDLFFGSDWEQRKIKQLIDKDKNQKWE